MSTENFLAVEFGISQAQALGLEGQLALLRDCCRWGMPPDVAVGALKIFIHALADGDLGKAEKLLGPHKFCYGCARALRDEARDS